jgi:hypothetical protein
MGMMQRHDEAIFLLMSVPRECAVCYDKAMDATGALYQAKVERDGKILLSEANMIWNSGQDAESARQACMLLASVDPASACFADAMKLADKIADKVKLLEDRAWQEKKEEVEFQREVMRKKLSIYENALRKEEDLERERIDAYREIQRAWAVNQPKTVYQRFW